MAWYFYHLFGPALVEVQGGEARAGSSKLHAKLSSGNSSVFYNKTQRRHTRGIHWQRHAPITREQHTEK